MKSVSVVLAAAAMAIAPAGAFAQDASLAKPLSAPGLSHGRTLFGPAGRIGAIYRVTANGSAQLIMDGRLVTVPVSTISDQGGRITTTMSRKDLRALR